MTDQKLYESVRDELFKTGSCKPNQWYLVKVVDGEKVAAFEAIYPKRGNIKIRRPVSKYGINGYGEQTYLYDVYKFTNKQELKYDGQYEDVRPDEYVNV